MNEVEAIRVFMGNDIQSLDPSNASVLLLEYPNIVHFRDQWGWTPLMMAAYFANIKVIKVLVQHGANVNDTSYCGEDCASDVAKETTPLMIVVGAGGSKLNIFRCVRYLLNHGANPNIKNARNECAIDICSYWINHRKYICATDFDITQYNRMVKSILLINFNV
jgi:ankyrin repeat protein